MALTKTYQRAAVVQQSNFQTNSYTSGDQWTPEVLGLSNGGFVSAYVNQAANPFIRLNFYDADFNLIGTDQSVDDFNVQGQPSLTELANGNVLVVWANNSGDDFGLQARLFSQDGEGFFPSRIQLSPENLGNNPANPQVAALADGGFVMSYYYAGDIYFGRYTAAGALASPGLPQVNTVATTGTQYDSNIAVLADGGFVITFTDMNPADWTIRGAVYNADGSVRKADFPIGLTGDNQQSAVVALPNGNWAVVYTDTGWPSEQGSAGITLQIFDPAGANVTPGNYIHVNTPSAAHESDPDVAVLENGYIVVTWTNVGAGGDIHARVFKQNGSPVTLDGDTDEFVITGSTGKYSAVSGLPGGFITSWEDNVTSDGDGGQITSTIQALTRTTIGDGADDAFFGDALDDFVDGGGGDDTLGGADGNDGISGGAGSDLLFGDDGNDHIGGGAGNDGIIGGIGNDTLDGGTGDDTAVFSGNLASYTIQDFGAQIVVAGPDGTDMLTGIEHLQFDNTTLDIVDDGNPMFDALFYLSRSPDVFAAGIDPLAHFNASGWHEGRDPNPFFDTSGYLAVNKDVAAAGINPLDHYRQSGWHEGRDPSAWFDTTLYLIHNPDVAAAGIDPLAHYLANGFSEGRAAYAAVGAMSDGFDAQYYLFHNPDVAAAGVDPLFQFNVVGWQEGRNPNAYFDTAGYLSHYTDVAAAGINPLQHYEAIGWKEGRDPSAGFDTLGYLAANPDVAAAGVNPLDHFLQHGIYEGRQAVNDAMWG